MNKGWAIHYQLGLNSDPTCIFKRFGKGKFGKSVALHNCEVLSMDDFSLMNYSQFAKFSSSVCRKIHDRFISQQLVLW